MECISQEIKVIIGQACGVEIVNELGEEDDIKSQLSVDSLQMVKIITDIECKYQCDLSEIFICEKNITIKVLREYVTKRENMKKCISVLNVMEN